MIVNIVDGFLDRTTAGANDIALERISSSYKVWKELQSQASPEYQVSREWLPIYSNYMQKIIVSLTEGDLPQLKKMYENFFREPLSTGLHGLHFEMVEKYMTAGQNPSNDDLAIYLKTCMAYAQNFLLNCRNVPVNMLCRPPIGNPYGYKLDGMDIFVCAEYHYYYAEKIRILLKECPSSTVLELGGGFGGMAYYLLRDFPGVKYIGVDLPENAALQAYYLMSHFPDLNIKLWNEPGVGDVAKDYDVYIMPNFAIHTLKDNSVNLSFNSYSLAEMSIESINNYIKIICSITKKYIYHLNHVYWEVSADNFPINFEKFELLFRNPTMWGKDTSRYDLDHHEFLYIAR